MEKSASLHRMAGKDGYRKLLGKPIAFLGPKSKAICACFVHETGYKPAQGGTKAASEFPLFCCT
jgi:hypothetical protein